MSREAGRTRTGRVCSICICIPQTNPPRVRYSGPPTYRLPCTIYHLSKRTVTYGTKFTNVLSGAIPQGRGSLDGRTRAALERRSRAVRSRGALPLQRRGV
ncbi:unnamed protein product [Ectocarpus sp. 6 AP-2014]